MHELANALVARSRKAGGVGFAPDLPTDLCDRHCAVVEALNCGNEAHIDSRTTPNHATTVAEQPSRESRK
jgi:hypothetical protein